MTDEREIDAVAARFAPRLRELREAAGLSQTQLAEKSGVPQATVAAYELGRHSPTWRAVVRLAHALGQQVEAFRAAPTTRAEKNQDTT